MIADPAASLFHEFLYATIGEDKNGMELTVLSTLARQNLDPWEEAALLSRLSVATALQKLISLLGASPGHASIGERTALAGRLIPLLPNRAAALGLPENAAPAVLAPKRATHMTEFSLVLIYIVVMALGQWIFWGSSMSQSAPSATAAAAALGVPGAADATSAASAPAPAASED